MAAFIAGLEALAAVGEVRGHAVLAQLGDLGEQHPTGLLAERDGEHAGGGGEFELDALRLQGQHGAVDAQGPADGRSAGPPIISDRPS
ncbi:hypothetical protein GCM10023238_27700 [Streptomyces heliomycini]